MRFTLLLVLFVCSLANSRSSRFVINGFELQPYQLPQMTELKANRWGCSATLIGPRVVVTAGHCVQLGGFQDFDQELGPFPNEKKRYRARMIVHPDFFSYDEKSNLPYDFALKNDIAIGILNEDVIGVDPISITDQAPALQDVVLFAGRGRPLYKRMWGQGRLITLSPIGATLRGFGENLQVADSGDSGGPNFVIDPKTHELRVFAVTSTSTRQNDWTQQENWPEALPYTQGLTRILPAIAQVPRRSRSSGFLESVAQRYQLQICGLNTTCKPISLESFQ